MTSDKKHKLRQLYNFLKEYDVDVYHHISTYRCSRKQLNYNTKFICRNSADASLELLNDNNRDNIKIDDIYMSDSKGDKMYSLRIDKNKDELIEFMRVCVDCLIDGDIDHILCDDINRELSIITEEIFTYSYIYSKPVLDNLEIYDIDREIGDKWAFLWHYLQYEYDNETGCERNIEMSRPVIEKLLSKSKVLSNTFMIVEEGDCCRLQYKNIQPFCEFDQILRLNCKQWSGLDYADIREKIDDYIYKTLELIEARLEYDGEKYEDTIQSLREERNDIYNEYIHCIIVDFLHGKEWIEVDKKLKYVCTQFKMPVYTIVYETVDGFGNKNQIIKYMVPELVLSLFKSLYYDYADYLGNPVNEVTNTVRANMFANCKIVRIWLLKYFKNSNMNRTRIYKIHELCKLMMRAAMELYANEYEKEQDCIKILEKVCEQDEDYNTPITKLNHDVMSLIIDKIKAM